MSIPGQGHFQGKKRVIVISDLGGGGTQRVIVRLAREWQERGITVAVITLSTPDSDQFSLPEAVERIALDCRGETSGLFSAITGNIRRIVLLRKAILGSQSTEVASFIAGMNILTIIACTGLKLTLVISERNDPSRQYLGRIWEFLRRNAYGKAYRVTANSRQALKAMSGYVPERKLLLVPNFMPVWPETPPAVSERDLVILAVGRLYPQKAYDRLLKIFAQSRARELGWKLVILGEGPERKKLEKLSANLGIEEVLSLEGHTRDVKSWYDRAGLYVMMSRHEGTSNAMIEAIASGLPMIISESCEDAAYYIRELHCGETIDPGNIQESAQTLDRFMEDESLREHYAEGGRKGLSRFFSAEVVIKSWEEAFE